MAKLRTSIVDAAAAADITVVGGSDEVPCAWSGGASAEDKKRLAGSLATMRDGKYGYFPVAPGAVLFKTFGTGDSTVLKAKLSLTGAETGTYHSAEELGNMIDRVWPAVCTVQAATGARAGDVCVGQALVSISPVIGTTPCVFCSLR